MWSPLRVARPGDSASGRAAVEVLGLEDLAELLHAPVGDQELQAGPRAQPAVAVVAEDRDDALPDVGDVVEGDPDAELLGQHRVGRQAAADPQVEAGTVLGVVDADEGDVVDLGGAVERRVAGGGGLELARQVGVLRVADVAALDLGQRRGGVDDLVLGDAGDRRAEEAAGRVAAGLEGAQADRVEPRPDLGHVLDLDPVVLDVLPVGDVGGVAREVGRDPAERAQLRRPEQRAVAAHPHHEVAVVELVRLQRGGLAAVEAGGPLRVEAHPAEPAAQVGRVDGVEAALGVDGADPGLDVERVVVLLGLLVGVERLAVAEGPLALAALGRGRERGRAGRGLLGHGGGSLAVGRRATRQDPTREDGTLAVGLGPCARDGGLAGGGVAITGTDDRSGGRHIMLRVRPRSTWRRTTRNRGAWQR